MDKLIITVAQTGAFHGKSANPNLPEQPSEIIQSACDCWNAGASVVHVHARDQNGVPTNDAEVFGEILRGIRARCKAIVQFTTAPLQGRLTIEQRAEPLDLRPEMASLDLGTLIRNDGLVIPNSRAEYEFLARAMKERGIKPEMEIFSHSNMEEVSLLIEKGLVEKPYVINFVLGFRMQGGISATPSNLLALINMLPPDAVFNVGAISAAQVPLTTLSIILGGHTRVGFEDNIYYSRGELAQSNAQLVERTARLARELGREVATPDEARQMMGIGSRS